MPHTQPTLVRFQPEVLCCMSHPPLSPVFLICLLLDKGVYARKNLIGSTMILQFMVDCVLLKHLKLHQVFCCTLPLEIWKSAEFQ